jgi:hypothetical protein
MGRNNRYHRALCLAGGHMSTSLSHRDITTEGTEDTEGKKVATL